MAQRSADIQREVEEKAAQQQKVDVQLILVRQQEAKLDQLTAEHHRRVTGAHSGTQADAQIQKTQGQFKAAKDRQKAKASQAALAAAGSAPKVKDSASGLNPVVQLERVSVLPPPSTVPQPTYADRARQGVGARQKTGPSG